MLLQDWLVREGLSYGQFGSVISRSAEAVRRYANGERIPDRDAMKGVVRETCGEVTPNDFYGLVPHGQLNSSAVSRKSSGNASDITAAQHSEAA